MRCGMESLMTSSDDGLEERPAALATTHQTAGGTKRGVDDQSNHDARDRYGIVCSQLVSV